MSQRANGIMTAEEWRSAAQAAREARAELLLLPSGATILAVKPEPLEWIMSGRIPQRLLAAALQGEGALSPEAEIQISREEILALAAFAAQLVKASVVRPAIGEGPDEIRLDDIPIADRAFIFEWACRALARPAPSAAGVPAAASTSVPQEVSSDKLERFRAH
jgi:hypothetical protein